MINPIHHSQVRQPCGDFHSIFASAGFLLSICTHLILAVLLFYPPEMFADEGELNAGQARQQCLKGKTIYCLALGIEEEKAGQQERALELYRTACEKHPTPGHLRACTPLLSLARKMKRLDVEVAPLEARCRGGKPVTCFYLGQEYLKLVEIEAAARHLEPLCRNHFRPPDPANYGPCYHLAKGFEQARQWNQARELFQFDCKNHEEKGQPSCASLKEFAEMEKVHRELAQKGIRSFDPIEAALLFVVFMSILNVWVWFKGGRWGLKYLMWVAPTVVWSAALTWVYWPDKPEYPSSQWAVIYFALLLVSGMAVIAFRKFHALHISS